jgi:hypothetical protein
MYKAVFNPDRTDLGIGPRSLWRLHHGPPPTVLFRQTWRYSRRPLNRGGTVTIPRVPPGRYLLAIYDGGEGGQHYSWETFTVTAAKAGTPDPRPPREAASRGVAISVAVAATVAALLVGYLAGRRRRAR